MKKIIKSEDKKNQPLISIVMPCWNVVDYIERSIRSVIEQDYPRFELFIKDGGSTDGTLDIIKNYAKKHPKKIKWASNKDKGQTDAINYGLKRVKGEILTYLNADDVYKPGTLNKIGNYFTDNKNTKWVYGMCDIIDGDDKIIREWITRYKNLWLKNYSYVTLLIVNYISQMTVFWRREAWQKTGDLDINQKYVMDYDYWLRLGKKYKPGFIPEYIASFRIIPTTKSSTGFLLQFKDEYNVARRYTKNKIILALHYLHYNLIITAYTVMKFLNNKKSI